MKNLRTFAIIDYLKEKKYCSVNELMEHFHVSPATIHRDIASLVKNNQLRKVHGGVAYVDPVEATDKMTVLSSTFQDRINWNQKLKLKISELAMQAPTWLLGSLERMAVSRAMPIKYSSQLM